MGILIQNGAVVTAETTTRADVLIAGNAVFGQAHPADALAALRASVAG